VEVVTGRDLRPVYADSAMVQQALTNLCFNARDAMPDGGRLTIEVDGMSADHPFCQAHPKLKPGPYLRLRISDTGHGIPPDCLSHIFEPFFTTKGVGEGTGLNLAMVYGIVEQHRGTIEVQSTPQGTCFTIHLPAAREQAAEFTRRDPAPATGAETILVAEDEPAISVYISRILKKVGYTVLTAADGEQAVDLFRSQGDAISLVLLDMIMPKRTGRSACEAIRALRPEVPVIFLSGYDPADSQVAFLRNQDLELLQKPINREQLLRTVRRLLDTRRDAALAEGLLATAGPAIDGALDPLEQQVPQ
jgi:CheY-like chemotaxis protein